MNLISLFVLVILKLTLSNSFLNYCKVINDVYIMSITKIIIYEDVNKIPLVKPNDLCIKNMTNTIFNIKDKYNKRIPENFDFFSLSQITLYLTKLKTTRIIFIQPNGFEILIFERDFNTKLEDLKFQAILIQTKIKFFLKNNYINKSCEHFQNKTVSSFINKAYFEKLSFKRSRLKEKICPFIFQNLKIDEFFFSPVVDTFYLSSKLKFYKLDKHVELNNRINRLILSQTIRLNLDENLLDPNVFKNLNSLQITGNINSIQQNLFTKFSNIENFLFDGQNFRQQAHKTQLKWAKSINSDIKLNFSNVNEIFKKTNYFKFLNILFRDPGNIDYGTHQSRFNLKNTFPDEDFCIYKDFPFDQLIFFRFDIYNFYLESDQSLTCTFLWITHKLNLLILAKPQLSESEKLKLKNLIENLKQCNFDKRIKFCLINTNLIFLDRKSIEEIQYYNILILYILDFFSIPLASFVGMLISALSVMVISKIDKKEDKKIIRQFYYLKMNGIFNFCICLIENFRLIYIWPNTIGNGIEHYVISQYFRIIFREYFLNCLRFCSSSCLIMFSMIRCSMAKDSQSLSNPLFLMDPKKFTKTIVCISLIVCFIKPFSYEINFFDPNLDYPSQKNLKYQLNGNTKGEIIFTVLNFICDFIIHFLFMLLHLIIDILLMINISNNLKKKQSITIRKMAAKYKRFQFKSFKLLILNTTLNLTLKLPGMFEFISINREIIDILISKGIIKSNFIFYFSILSRSYITHVLMICSIFFSQISIFTNFLLMYHFNSVFKKVLNNFLKKKLNGFFILKKNEVQSNTTLLEST